MTKIQRAALIFFSVATVLAVVGAVYIARRDQAEYRQLARYQIWLKDMKKQPPESHLHYAEGVLAQARAGAVDWKRIAQALTRLDLIPDETAVGKQIGGMKAELRSNLFAQLTLRQGVPSHASWTILPVE